MENNSPQVSSVEKFTSSPILEENIPPSPPPSPPHYSSSLLSPPSASPSASPTPSTSPIPSPLTPTTVEIIKEVENFNDDEKSQFQEFYQEIDNVSQEVNVENQPYDLSNIISINDIFKTIRNMQSSIGPGELYNVIQLAFTEINNFISKEEKQLIFGYNNSDFLIGQPLITFTYTLFSIIEPNSFFSIYGKPIELIFNNLVSQIKRLLPSNEFVIITPSRFKPVFAIQIIINGTFFTIVLIDYIRLNLKLSPLELQNYHTYFSNKPIDMVYSDKKLRPSLYDILIKIYNKAKITSFNCIETLPDYIEKTFNYLLREISDINTFYVNSNNYLLFIPNIQNYFNYSLLVTSLSSIHTLKYNPATSYYKTTFENLITLPGKTGDNNVKLLESVMDRITNLNKSPHSCCNIVLSGGKHLLYLQLITTILLKNKIYDESFYKSLKKIIKQEIPISSDEEKLELIKLTDEDLELYNYIIRIKQQKPSSDADYGIYMKQGFNKFLGRFIVTFLQSELQNLFSKYEKILGAPYITLSPVGVSPYEVSLCALHTDVNAIQPLYETLRLDSIQDEPETKALLDMIHLPDRIESSTSPFDMVEKGDIETLLYKTMTYILKLEGTDELKEEEIILSVIYLSKYCMITNNAMSSPLKDMFDILYTIFIEQNLISRISTGKVNKETGRITDCARLLLFDIIEKMNHIYLSIEGDKSKYNVLIQYANCLIDIIKNENSQLLVVIGPSQDIYEEEKIIEIEKKSKELYISLIKFTNFIITISVNDELKGFLFHSQKREDNTSSRIERITWLPYISDERILSEAINRVVFQNIDPELVILSSRAYSTNDLYSPIQNLFNSELKDITIQFFNACNILLNECSNINLLAKKTNNSNIYNSTYIYLLWYGINESTFSKITIPNYTKTNNILGLLDLFKNYPQLIDPLVDLCYISCPIDGITKVECSIYNLTNFFGLKNNSGTIKIKNITRELGFSNIVNIDEFKKILRLGKNISEIKKISDKTSTKIETTKKSYKQKKEDTESVSDDEYDDESEESESESESESKRKLKLKRKSTSLKAKSTIIPPPVSIVSSSVSRSERLESRRKRKEEKEEKEKEQPPSKRTRKIGGYKSKKHNKTYKNNKVHNKVHNKVNKQ